MSALEVNLGHDNMSHTGNTRTLNKQHRFRRESYTSALPVFFRQMPEMPPALVRLGCPTFNSEIVPFYAESILFSNVINSSAANPSVFEKVPMLDTSCLETWQMLTLDHGYLMSHGQIASRNCPGSNQRITCAENVVPHI